MTEEVTSGRFKKFLLKTIKSDGLMFPDCEESAMKEKESADPYIIDNFKVQGASTKIFIKPTPFLKL